MDGKDERSPIVLSHIENYATTPPGARERPPQSTIGGDGP
jgi:hypothetical protein